MQNDVVWEGIFKGLETRQVRRIEPIRHFFLPLKISKHPRITIFSVSCHSCHWFFLFLMVVQFIMQGSVWIQRRDTMFTLETRFGVCQGLMLSISFLSIAGQLIWLLKSHIHLATPVSCLWPRQLQTSAGQHMSKAIRWYFPEVLLYLPMTFDSRALKEEICFISIL